MTSTQSRRNFNRLIPIVRQPVSLSELEVLENGGPILGLHAQDGTIYSVVNNIPVLMPEFSQFPNKTVSMWAELQEKEVKAYRQSPVGVFSGETTKMALEFRDMVRHYSNPGTALDVGCGALPRPSYMKETNLDWFGIDPYLGDQDREFPFVVGVAECLPFANESFDNTVFATTVDHILKPELAIIDALRTLKAEGLLFLWYSDRPVDARYLLRKFGVTSKYNKHHMYGFTDETLKTLVEECGFRTEEVVSLSDGQSHVLVARKFARKVIVKRGS